MSVVIQAIKPNHAETLEALRATLAAAPDRMVAVECHHADELGETVVHVNGATFRFPGGHWHIQHAIPHADWRDGPVADEAVIQARTLLERLSWDDQADDYAAGRDDYREAAKVAGCAVPV